MAGNTGEGSKTMSKKEKYIHISGRMVKSNSVLAFFYLAFIILFTYLIVGNAVDGVGTGKNPAGVDGANPFLGTIGGMLGITSTVLALRRNKKGGVPRLLMFPLVLMSAAINALGYDLVKGGIMFFPFVYQIYEGRKGNVEGKKQLQLKFRNYNIHQYIGITIIAAAISAVIGGALTKAPTYEGADQTAVAYIDAYQFIFTVLGAFLAARTHVSAQYFFGISNIFAMVLAGLTSLGPGIITNIIFFSTSIFGYITGLDDYNKQQKSS